MISICIPSYNRPKELLRLLQSIKNEKGNFEILIAEDNSPSRTEIIKTVNDFHLINPNLQLRLILNNENLGYDGNLRNLIENSVGDYCMFMGDDDIICEGAILKISEIIDKNKNIGFILRSWEEVDLNGEIISIQKYYPNDFILENGLNSIISFYRKSVFISGLVFHRETASNYKTSDLDGKLLYQLFLLTNILLDLKGYYVSNIITIRISGADHYFGSSKSEKNNFTPKTLSINHSLNFMQGFIDIIDYVEKNRSISIKKEILKDFSKYSYGFLSIQREKGIRPFYLYTKELYKKGYGNSIYFYIYFLMLSVLGLRLSNAFILLLKKKLRSIPNL